MSGTVILPLPARGATLMRTSGAAPRLQDAAHPTIRFYQIAPAFAKKECSRQVLRRRHQRLSAALLRVGDFALHERDFEIFINVNLLGPEIDDLIRLPENRDHLVGRLADLNCSRR